MTYVRAVEEERDVEIFERIPWDSLEEKPERRWMAYLLAAVVVLGAVGVSLGRQMGSSPAAPPSASMAPIMTSASTPEALPSPSPTAAAAPEMDATWSEADLMALPAEWLEMSAAAMAEWFVVEFFTREEPGEDRSFVDWARTREIEWVAPSLVEVTVLVRRLAAAGDGPYQRLGTEAWVVTTELTDDGWTVVQGPVQSETPELATDFADADQAGSEGSVGAGKATDGRRLEEVEWVDSAGVIWKVRQWSEEGP